MSDQEILDRHTEIPQTITGRIQSRSSTRVTSVNASLLVAATLSASCEEPVDLPPLEFESERTRVGVASGQPVCGGDLRFLDEHVALIEDRLEVRRDSKIDVYLYSPPDIEPCGASPFGCYKPGEDYIATAWQFADHELVHAVTTEIRFPSLFWSEGAAELFRTEGTRINPTRDLLVEDLSENHDPDYFSGGHLSRFIIEEYGWEPYRQIIRGEPIESALDQSEAELVASYLAAAPHSYPSMFPCQHPELPEVATGEWAEQLAFACESDEATQFETVGSSGSNGAAVLRRVALDAGRYELHQQGGDGVIVVGCQTEALEAEPPLFSNGDVPNMAEAQQTAFGKRFDADVVHTLNLTSGIYRLAISSGTNEDAAVDLSLRAVE